MIEKNKENKNTSKTTGHEWDGISEYNIPAPRWWLIVWIVCIVWALIYWVFYPTWPVPGGHSKGILNWSQQSQLNESQMEITEKKSTYLEKISKMSLQEIQKDPNLMEFALNGGRASFKENCAGCHGSGAQGSKGFPNLNDDDWLWGGTLDQIQQTLYYGIRSGHDKARTSQMPSFGLDKILTKKEISDVVDHVISLAQTDKVGNENGAKIFASNCASCHGLKGEGNRSVGAPNLSDAIWLYGKEKSEITFSVYYAYAGVMPYWTGRLDENTIKQLALYVHSLGGGE
ncbi:MAG: cytochrome-c oxidase, cbb3-type subunit III [Proteobacteria bacterium]|nr:cytochrome-c oxidase, cbb3-type subunit III [Pseudomonadota bacterium]